MYHLMPAGIDSRVLDCYAYFRYGKTDNNTITFTTSKKETHIKTPDREILLTPSRNIRPENYDEYICLNPYSNNSLAPQHLDYLLVSPSCADKVIYPRTNQTTKFFGDSGGAQLKFGTVGYVDPEVTMKFYNEHCDSGTALDVPPRRCDNNDWTLTLCAKAQKRNTDIFKSIGKRPDLKLLNCLHGFTLKQSRNYAKAVDDPMFDGWACGCDSPLVGATLQNLLVAMERGGSHFHLFGIASFTIIPILAWLGRAEGTTVTSDSSTILLSAKKARKFLHVSIKSRNICFEEQTIAPQKTFLDMHHLWYTPCSCPMCTRVRYLSVYSLDAPYVDLLLFWHSLMTYLSYAKFWSNAANSVADYAEYLTYFRLLSPQRTSNRHTLKMQGIEVEKNRFEFAISMLQYVKYAQDHGLDKANKQFRSSLVAPETVSMQANSMFAKPTAFEKGSIREILPSYLR
jgi:hypothetical protein